MRGILALAVAASLMAPKAMMAQTEDDLRRAVELYDNLQLEPARDMFLRVVNSPFEVTTEQRVRAFKYLGAIYVSLAQPDSAALFFRAAIERDPFLDLEPQAFTESERAAYAQARQRTFRVGLRPIDSAFIDPRTDAVPVQVVTTHSGQLRVEIDAVDRPLRFPIFDGSNDGIQQFAWSGTDPSGNVVPAGNYRLRVSGVSNMTGRRVDSTSVLFAVEHVLPSALEDTIRDIHPSERLPERHPPSVATRDLAVGLGVAAAAILAPIALGSSDLGNPPVFSISVASLAGASGIFAFFQRRKNPEIPENRAFNQAAENRRRADNERIRRENAAILAETKLVIRPAVGAGR